MNPPLDYLNLLYGDLPDDLWFELTFILPPEYNPQKLQPITKHYRLGIDRPDWDEVERLNSAHYSVYYGVTPKKRRTPKRAHKNDTAYIQALWLDVDNEDTEAALKSIYTIHIPPSVIISTGGGLHGIWKIYPIEVTPDNLHEIERTLRGMAKAAQSDTSVADLARVLRLPGTINTKPKRNGVQCTIVDWLPGWTRLEDFADYAALEKPRERIARVLPRYKPSECPPFVRNYIESVHVEGTRNASLNAAAFYMHSNGYSQSETLAMLQDRALADGLDEHEIAVTIESVFRAQPGDPSYLSKTNKRRMMAGDKLMNRLDSEE